MTEKLNLETLVKMTESYAISLERLVTGYNQLYGWGRNTNPNDESEDYSPREKKRLIALKSSYYGNAYRTMDILESMSVSMRDAWKEYQGEPEEDEDSD